MNAALAIGLFAALMAQTDLESAAPLPPERIRILAIWATGEAGAEMEFDAGLAPVQDFLETLPFSDFRELGFHDLEAPYGETVQAVLNSEYTLYCTPQRLTDSGEVVMEAHVDMRDGDAFVEALRVNGRSARGKGMVFRGFPLPGGEMVVVLSVAEAREEGSGGGGSGQSEAGQSGSGKRGDGTTAGDAPATGSADGELPAGEESEPDPHAMAEEEDDGEVSFLLAPAEEGIEDLDREAPLPPELANLEGILRTLEEIDRREQTMKRARRFDTQVRGDWW